MYLIQKSFIKIKIPCHGSLRSNSLENLRKNRRFMQYKLWKTTLKISGDSIEIGRGRLLILQDRLQGEKECHGLGFDY